MKIKSQDGKIEVPADKIVSIGYFKVSQGEDFELSLDEDTDLDLKDVYVLYVKVPSTERKIHLGEYDTREEAETKVKNLRDEIKEYRRSLVYGNSSERIN